MVSYTRSRKLLRRKAPKKTIRKAAKLPKSQALAVKAIVKKQMNKVIELKHTDYNFEPLAINALYHNKWYAFETDPFTLAQGVGDSEALNPSNRIGDSIYAKRINWNIMFYNFSDRPNLALRILILAVHPDTPFFTDPCYHPQAVSGLIQPVDTESSRYKSTVYDKVFCLNNNISNIQGTTRDTKFHWQYSLPVNKVIKYEDSNSGARNLTYQVFALAYDTVSSLTTDNIMRFSYARRTLFQDA